MVCDQRVECTMHGSMNTSSKGTSPSDPRNEMIEEMMEETGQEKLGQD